MRRAALLIALLAAAPAARAGEGVYITLDGGYGLWNGKETFNSRLATQVGKYNADLLTGTQMPDGPLAALRLGYNIGGHVAFEAAASLHPWGVLGSSPGASSFFGLGTRWFPLQGLLRPGRQADFSLQVGVDYFIQGGSGLPNADGSGTISNTGRGLDGMAFEFGGTFELYPARWVSLGLTPRLYSLHPLRYFTNFGGRDAGGQIPLVGNVGGTFLTLALSVTFHFEPLPD